MTTTDGITATSPFAIFRNRNFTLLWTGQLVSTIGNALASLAASILVYRLTGSALSVGLMLMATAVPSIFVGLIAGVFVDRYDRKRIMIAADLPVATGSRFRKGDTVIVVRGPFAGITGIFVRYRGQGRVIVTVEALGQYAAVEVEEDHIEKQPDIIG